MEKTTIAVEDGTFALTLGGDHSVAIGSVAGVMRAQPDAAVVWVVGSRSLEIRVGSFLSFDE